MTATDKKNPRRSASAPSLKLADAASEAVRLFEDARDLLNTGELVEARERLNDALIMDPDLAAAHYLLACVALRADEPAEAVSPALRAVELSPMSSDFLNVLGAAQYGV